MLGYYLQTARWKLSMPPHSFKLETVTFERDGVLLSFLQAIFKLDDISVRCGCLVFSVDLEIMEFLPRLYCDRSSGIRVHFLQITRSTLSERFHFLHGFIVRVHHIDRLLSFHGIVVLGDHYSCIFQYKSIPNQIP
jgi:hypothetical protein